jgi:hypothetical protein
MGRSIKATVDYFPHDTNCGARRTVETLNLKYGNDGYAVWFKILELLGNSNGLHFDFSDAADWEYFVAKMNVPEEKLDDILRTVVRLGAIDKDLFESKILWVQNFVDRLTTLWDRRIGGPPEKPVSNGINVINDDENAQSKEKESKESKESKEKESIDSLTERRFARFWEAYPLKINKKEAQRIWYELKPDEQLTIIIVDAVMAYKQTKQWQQEDGKYVPYPANFLRNRRWEDEVPKQAQQQQTQQKREKYYKKLKVRQDAEAEARLEKIYTEIPEIREIDKTNVELNRELFKAMVSGKKGKQKTVESLNARIVHNQQERTKLLEEADYVEDYTDVKYICERCKDTGTMEDGGLCECFPPQK